jgi:hypothetical protein
VFTNCVKTHQKTLNHQILEQKLLFNDGIKNLQTDCTVTKKQLKEIKKKLSMESKSKFALVPFFSVLERNFKIDLRLSAFVQKFTCILYCPDIAKCPWLLQMIPMNISRSKLTSLKMPSCVECFVLLHLPIIIEMKELEAINLKVQQNVTDDEMDDDIYTQEMSDFFSNTEIVTGCIFKMEDNSFSWMYEIELNKQYQKFGDLILDCLVEDENDEICMFDFTNGRLQDRISSDMKLVSFKQSRVNAELVSLAMALNGDKETVFFRTENSKKIEVTHTTIVDTLMLHYPIKERNLKQPGNDDTSRRS